MLGTKLYKNNKSDMASYTKTAVWCNANNAHITDKGEYYEVVENAVYVPSKEERIAQLSVEYENARLELARYYMMAVLEADVDSQVEIKSELDKLKEQFANDLTNASKEV